MPRKEAAQLRLAEQVGRDGWHLLWQLWLDTSPAHLRSLLAVGQCARSGCRTSIPCQAYRTSRLKASDGSCKSKAGMKMCRPPFFKFETNSNEGLQIQSWNETVSPSLSHMIARMPHISCGLIGSFLPSSHQTKEHCRLEHAISHRATNAMACMLSTSSYILSSLIVFITPANKTLVAVQCLGARSR